MRIHLFASCLINVIANAILLQSDELKDTIININESDGYAPQMLAQTGQLSEMATEIAQAREEKNESNKKHMGLKKYGDSKKVRKVLEQKTMASQDLAAELDRIMKLPVPGKKKEPQYRPPDVPPPPPTVIVQKDDTEIRRLTKELQLLKEERDRIHDQYDDEHEHVAHLENRRKHDKE